MKKKGFVFVESIAVLVVIILALTLFISSYKVLVRKSKVKDYYNLPKDKYLLYNIINFGDPDATYNVNTSFITQKSTCAAYMNEKMTNCSQLFTDMHLERFLVIYDLKSALEDGTIVDIKDGSYEITSDIIEYLKTLKKSDSDGNGLDYVVGVFKRDNKNYYASLVLTKKTEKTESTIINPDITGDTELAFTYTGKFRVGEVTYENTSYTTTDSNWEVYFLTDGVLYISSITSNVDISVTGGGGGGASPGGYGGGTAGGGCGGATAYVMNQQLSTTSYNIDIGAGGAGGKYNNRSTASDGRSKDMGYAGKETTFKQGSTTIVGAAGGGGSGTGKYRSYQDPNDPDGSYIVQDTRQYNVQCTQATTGTGTVLPGGKGAKGASSANSSYNGEVGADGNYAFGSSSYPKYGAGGGSGSATKNNVSPNAINGVVCGENVGGSAGGGRGGSSKGTSPCAWTSPTAGEENTGSGGGGGTPGWNTTHDDSSPYRTGAAGGSGIVIMRNAR